MDETGMPPAVTVRDGVVEAAGSWDELEPVFRGGDCVVRLFGGRTPVRVLAAHKLDADRVRVTCARHDAVDLVGAGIFTATIARGAPLPLGYGRDGIWDDEDAVDAALDAALDAATGKPLDPRVTEVVAVLPRNVAGHVAHSVIEMLSTRWPTMELRGRSDGTVEVRVGDALRRPRRVTLDGRV